MLSSVMADGSNFTLPRNWRPTMPDTIAARSTEKATRPSRSSSNPGPKGSDDHGPPRTVETGVPIAVAISEVASTVSASIRPSTRIGCPSTRPSRPLTAAPAILPSSASKASLSPSTESRVRSLTGMAAAGSRRGSRASAAANVTSRTPCGRASARRIVPLASASNWALLNLAPRRSSPPGGPLAVRANCAGRWSMTTNRSSPRSVARPAPSSAARRPSRRISAAIGVPTSPLPSAETLTRIPAMAPSMASLADVFAPGAVPMGATSSLAASLADAARCIRFFKVSAASGTNFAASAATPVSRCASTVRATDPRGDGEVVSMRPLTLRTAPPKSAIASRSMTSPLASNLSAAVAPRASMPA